MDEVALGLGGNRGDVEEHFRHAISQLGLVLDDLAVAPLYRTSPVSEHDQPPFLNTALVASSTLEPADLLAFAKRLEMWHGRRRGPRHGPRPLDIDLLLFGQRLSRTPELVLPHPGLRSRRFVLAPLAEVAPNLQAPPDGRPVADLLDELENGGRVELVRSDDWLHAEASSR